MTTTRHQFPTDVAGLPEAQAPQLVKLADGDRFELTIPPDAKRVGNATARMLAYNGSIPGPTRLVRQDSEALVDIDDRGDSQ